MKQRFIQATPIIRQKLKKAFQVDERTIYNALHYQANTDIQRRIRHHAIQLGATPMILIPDPDPSPD